MSTVRGTLRTETFITRRMLQDNPGVLFVFGDNLMHAGFGGQAKEMRGEPNAVGIPTKISPSMSAGSFFSDADYDKVRPVLDLCFQRLAQHMAQGGDVVFPKDGIGTGLAQLGQRAPRIAAYLLARIESLRTSRAQANPPPAKDSWSRVEKLEKLGDPDKNKGNSEAAAARVAALEMAQRLTTAGIKKPKIIRPKTEESREAAPAPAPAPAAAAEPEAAPPAQKVPVQAGRHGQGLSFGKNAPTFNPLVLKGEKTLTTRESKGDTPGFATTKISGRAVYIKALPLMSFEDAMAYLGGPAQYISREGFIIAREPGNANAIRLYPKGIGLEDLTFQVSQEIAMKVIMQMGDTKVTIRDWCNGKIKPQLYEISTKPYPEQEKERAEALKGERSTRRQQYREPNPPCSDTSQLSVLPITPAMLWAYINANLIRGAYTDKAESVIRNSKTARSAFENLVPTFGNAGARGVLCLRVREFPSGVPWGFESKAPAAEVEALWAKAKQSLTPASENEAGEPPVNFGVYSRHFGPPGSPTGLRNCFGEKLSEKGSKNLLSLYEDWDNSRKTWSGDGSTKHPGYFWLPGNVAAMVSGPSNTWFNLYGPETRESRRPYWADLLPIMAAGLDANAVDICLLLPDSIFVERNGHETDITGQEDYQIDFVRNLQAPEIFQNLYARVQARRVALHSDVLNIKEIDAEAFAKKESLKASSSRQQAPLHQRVVALDSAIDFYTRLQNEIDRHLDKHALPLSYESVSAIFEAIDKSANFRAWREKSPEKYLKAKALVRADLEGLASSNSVLPSVERIRKAVSEKKAVEVEIAVLKKELQEKLIAVDMPRAEADAQLRRLQAKITQPIQDADRTRSIFEFSVRNENPNTYYGEPKNVQRWSEQFIGRLLRDADKGISRAETQGELKKDNLFLSDFRSAYRVDPEAGDKITQAKFKLIDPFIPSTGPGGIRLSALPAKAKAVVTFMQDWSYQCKNPTVAEEQKDVKVDLAPLVPVNIDIFDAAGEHVGSKPLSNYASLQQQYNYFLQQEEPPAGFIPKIEITVALFQRKSVKIATGTAGVKLLEQQCLQLKGYDGEWFLGIASSTAQDKNWSVTDTIEMKEPRNYPYPYLLGKRAMMTLLNHLFRLDLMATDRGYSFQFIRDGLIFPWNSKAVPFLLNKLPLKPVLTDDKGKPLSDNKGRRLYAKEPEWYTWCNEVLEEDPDAAVEVNAKTYVKIVKGSFGSTSLGDAFREVKMAKGASGRERGGRAVYGTSRTKEGSVADLTGGGAASGFYALVMKALSGFHGEHVQVPASRGDLGSLYALIRSNWPVLKMLVDKSLASKGYTPLPTWFTLDDILQFRAEGTTTEEEEHEDKVRGLFYEQLVMDALDLLVDDKQEQYVAMLQKNTFRPWREDLHQASAIEMEEGNLKHPYAQNVPDGFNDQDDPVFSQDVVETVRAIENRGRGRQARPPRPRRRSRT